LPKKDGAGKIYSSEKLPAALQVDSRLVRTRLGEFYFYLCVPEAIYIADENQVHNANSKEEEEDFATAPGGGGGGVEGGDEIDKEFAYAKGVLAIDPGIRTFATGYSAAGLADEWGRADIGRICRLCHALDKLQSKWSMKEVSAHH